VWCSGNIPSFQVVVTGSIPVTRLPKFGFNSIFGRKKFRQNLLKNLFMNPYKISYRNLCESVVKTTPENVKEANEGLFNCTMTLPSAAKHCGMSQKEMKLTFYEYLKYNPSTYKFD
jgi:hypothetical protein